MMMTKLLVADLPLSLRRMDVRSDSGQEHVRFFWRACPKCKGKKVIGPGVGDKCPKCNGKGIVWR